MQLIIKTSITKKSLPYMVQRNRIEFWSINVQFVTVSICLFIPGISYKPNSALCGPRVSRDMNDSLCRMDKVGALPGRVALGLGVERPERTEEHVNHLRSRRLNIAGVHFHKGLFIVGPG